MFSMVCDDVKFKKGGVFMDYPEEILNLRKIVIPERSLFKRNDNGDYEYTFERGLKIIIPCESAVSNLKYPVEEK